MNNLQPYEKHLADKLHQVPVPDKDEGWKEMRKLLDRDMPEGGGGWGGNKKWWWMGITVAIIIVGLWTSQQFSENQKPGTNKSIASSEQGPLNESPASSTSTKNKSVQTSESASNDKSIATAPVVKSTVDDKIEKTQNSTANTNSSSKRESNSPTSTVGDHLTTAVAFEKRKDNVTVAQADITSINNRNQSIAGSYKKKSSTIKREQQGNSLTAIEGGAFAGNTEKKNNNGVAEVISSGSATNDPIVSVPQTARVYKTPEESAFISSYIAPSDLLSYSFQNPAEKYVDFPPEQQPLQAEPGKTDKAFAKEMRKKSIKDDNRKMSGKSMRGAGLEKDHELTFAAGLSLPQSFAIGNQQSPSYGVNAKPGTISDYLPVPFFQYHVNNRLFFQTELQFQAPQFTNRLLIAHSQHPVAPTNGLLEKNIFVEKLYYFNIPLNVYFSPVRNFYIGSGIQFSSLLSGVATYQDNRYTNGTLENSHSRVQGFKDDSIAAKLAPSEWRYQLEGNYYFNRFTLGARYNQALKQFVNLQPSAALPFTQGRNQSFLVYLRYNIWEERKKNVYSLASSW